MAEWDGVERRKDDDALHDLDRRLVKVELRTDHIEGVVMANSLGIKEIHKVVERNGAMSRENMERMMAALHEHEQREDKKHDQRFRLQIESEHANRKWIIGTALAVISSLLAGWLPHFLE
jgi:hypothetical protein